MCDISGISHIPLWDSTYRYQTYPFITVFTDDFSFVISPIVHQSYVVHSRYDWLSVQWGSRYEDFFPRSDLQLTAYFPIKKFLVIMDLKWNGLFRWSREVLFIESGLYLKIGRWVPSSVSMKYLFNLNRISQEGPQWVVYYAGSLTFSRS